jgi:pimeloyl-ACP methyl ester carboxylesterase
LKIDNHALGFSRRGLAARATTLIGGAAAVSVGLAGSASAQPAPAQAPPEKLAVAAGLTYQHIGRWDVARLNRILTVDTPAFTGFKVDYKPAQNAVNLYRVVYPSTIPEKNNRPTMASGLIAIPETSSKAMPVVSYQHGTVYLKDQAPSFPETSPETQLMIAQFAGRGDVVVGADYFGLGLSPEPEGYIVMGSHQQATTDMIRAGRAILATRGIEVARLCIAGWSQGGLVTMALLKRLEEDGVVVQAAATASAPVDPFVALNGYLNFPTPNAATWINSLFILSAFSYEDYYGVPGLAAGLINPAYMDICRQFYEKKAIDYTAVPVDLHKLIRPEYFNPQFFARSAYGRLVAEAQGYRWLIQTPTRNYFGGADEAVSPRLAKLVMEYQQAIGSEKVTAVSAGDDANHRGTFARAALEWKTWFDTLAG